MTDHRVKVFCVRHFLHVLHNVIIQLVDMDATVPGVIESDKFDHQGTPLATQRSYSGWSLDGSKPLVDSVT